METNHYYILALKEDLSHKQRANPNYSLRAYARDLGLNSSTLCQVLNGKRPLPLKSAGMVIQKLGLGDKEKSLFLESIYNNKTRLDDINISKNDERHVLDETYFKIIAEWEHFAVLTLFDLSDFEVNFKSISKKLGIRENRAEVVLNNLIQYQLISTNDQGLFQKTHSNVRTTRDIKSQALIESHKESLEMGKQKLEEVPLNQRDFSSLTIAVDPNKIEDAKTIIREFRLKMAKLMDNGDKTEVYHLAIQFYPQSVMEEK